MGVTHWLQFYSISMRRGFITQVDSMPLPSMLAFLERLGEDALAGDDLAVDRIVSLYRCRVLPDCDCEPTLKPCKRRDCVRESNADTCDCDLAKRLVFCEHLKIGRRHLLPLIAQAVILRYIFPDKYMDPPEPTPIASEIRVESKAAKAGVMEARARRGEALRLAVDRAQIKRWSWSEDERRRERIDREGFRKLNGTDSKVTTLVLHGAKVQPVCWACHSTYSEAHDGRLWCEFCLSAHLGANHGR